uniref:tRNA-splicing endonuclease subunit Sen2 n=1 Tax=Salarias fasciatus TaxID=181472 RepID=A0A672FA94_SALFA
MQADFRAPRRRTRVREDYQAPLPRDRTHFRAELINQHVLVRDPDHIQKLYKQGYFGKGILSRSAPDHSLSDQWEGEFPPVCSNQSRSCSQLTCFRSRAPGSGSAGSVPAEPQGQCEAVRSCRCVTWPSSFSSTLEVRRTPVSLSEYLQLGLEEAFFLVYSLGCLSVYLQQAPLSVVQLWRTFRSWRPDFVSSYAAYHHYRSRGWVPKGGGGAKYGVDFMLYRKGPPFYHASYSVVVQRADSAFQGPARRPFSWRSLAALSRITANVSKELLLCYVVLPADLSDAELDSPESLSRLTVQVRGRGYSMGRRGDQEG